MIKINDKRVGKLYVKWKGYDNFLTVGLIKKDVVWMSKYLSKSKFFRWRVKVELELTKYATKKTKKCNSCKTWCR